MQDTTLPLTANTDRLLAEGKVDEAKAAHDATVREQLAKAQAGETINLSDLFASKEQIVAREAGA